MKKIYLLAIAFMAFVVTASAQAYSGTCPPGKVPTAIRYTYTTVSGEVYCVVLVSNSWPNAELTLFAGSTQIPYLSTPPQSYIHTDANGGASFIYDCNTYNADIAQVCSPGLGCCRIQVVAGASLPIKLTSFTGRLKTDNSVSLDWSSAIEWDSYEYEVERSADGKTYDKVGTLKASGNSNEVVRYGFTDQLPAAGAYYYRLKQVDVNGSFEYSKVVYVNSKKGVGVITKVFPNPFTSEIQLIGATSADMTSANIKVFSITGQLMKYRIVGANAISIDDAAPKGMYIVKVKDQQFKLLKN
jgi:hypothetical protein